MRPSLVYHARVGLHELHPLTREEIDKQPGTSGIYVLFQVQIPVHVEEAHDLRQALVAAKARFTGATHFAAEAIPAGGPALAQRLRQLRQELTRVRTAGFVGSHSPRS